MEGTHGHPGRANGIELILPDWFYAGIMTDALVLTIDRDYFDLTGGLERWLYRLVRKHGGRQSTAGASTSTISTSSQALFRRSNASPTTSATSSADSRYPAISLPLRPAPQASPA